MERINDGRRNILVHGDADIDDLPVDGLDELPNIASTEPFLPEGTDEPEIYPGDVIFGVNNGEIVFGELIYDRVDEGTVVIPLNTGVYKLVTDGEFTSRFFRTDEIHIYDDISDDVVEMDVEFDEQQIERPQTRRPR